MRRRSVSATTSSSCATTCATGTATTATFRYVLTQADATSSDGLFQAGTVTVAFAAGSFGTADSTMNAAGLTQIITIQDPPMFTSSA